MIKILVSKQSNYPVKSSSVKKHLKDFFEKRGIVSDSYCSVAFVGEAKMLEIGKRYYKKDKKLHNVFSFVDSEVKGFKGVKDEKAIFLGEIVVCFPLVVKEANLENKLIEEKVLELVEHSAMHLLGIHHEGDR